MLLAHQGVNHQIGRVRFDDLSCTRFTDYVRLAKRVSCVDAFVNEFCMERPVD